MKEAFDRNCKELGIDLSRLMSDYQDSPSNYPDEWKSLAEAGLLRWPEKWEEGDEEMVEFYPSDMATLIMELSTRGTSISWEAVELATLVGGRGSTLLNSAGYGLFF